VDKLSTGGGGSLRVRLYARLVSSLTTWPDVEEWRFSAAVGAATLAAVGAVGFSSGLYALHPANLNGLPLRR
jgi:predicted Abi (CAAX) family protease